MAGIKNVTVKTGTKKKTYDAQKRHEYYMKHRKLKGKGKTTEATGKKTATKKKTKSPSAWEGLPSSTQVGKRAGRSIDHGELQEILADQNQRILDRVSSLKDQISKMSPEEKKKNKYKLMKEIKRLQSSAKLSAKISRMSGG